MEFVNKKNAKEACELLNSRVIGGKKSGYYHDDVWNLRYLKGFKWNHLTEYVMFCTLLRTHHSRAVRFVPTNEFEGKS